MDVIRADLGPSPATWRHRAWHYFAGRRDGGGSDRRPVRQTRVAESTVEPNACSSSRAYPRKTREMSTQRVFGVECGMYWNRHPGHMITSGDKWTDEQEIADAHHINNMGAVYGSDEEWRDEGRAAAGRAPQHGRRRTARQELQHRGALRSSTTVYGVYGRLTWPCAMSRAGTPTPISSPTNATATTSRCRSSMRLSAWNPCHDLQSGICLGGDERAAAHRAHRRSPRS